VSGHTCWKNVLLQVRNVAAFFSLRCLRLTILWKRLGLFSLLQEVTGITKLSVSVEMRHLWQYTEEMEGLTR